MQYRILHYGEKELREPCEQINCIDDELRTLVKDMFETMYKSRGVGLAAPQIGKNIQLAVIDIGDDPLVLINPKILKKSGKETTLEGCLSFPGLSENVERATRVIVKYKDINGDFNELEAEGLLARAVQHELDHLDGVMLVDRISKARKLQIKYDLEAIKRGETLVTEDETDDDGEFETDYA